uniref:Uncharacterized protein n=1 Tax=Amphimedon queenslandica TaxID=400682 RepID=A0A1X7VRB1_AMPQE
MSSIQSNVQHHSSRVNASGDRSVDRNSTLEMRASSQDHRGPSTSSRDRSGNLVVSGLPECPRNTARTVRAIQDQDKVISVLSSLCSSVSTHSIRDLCRLGKYVEGRSQPILVKLHRPSKW